MSDLLSSYAGDIKYLETQVNGATTQFTGTRMGQNNNFLLDQLIALQSATTTLATQPGRVLYFSVGVSMSFGGSTQTIYTAPAAIKSVWMIAPGLNVDLFSESFNSDPVPSFLKGRGFVGVSFTDCAFPVVSGVPNYVSLNQGFIRVQISGAQLQVYSNVGAYSKHAGDCMVLEPVWQGYIQAEDVVELRSWSEYALQKLGHNFNYLKKDLDDQNTNVNGFYLTNGQNIDNGFAIPNTTSHGSPNGKAFYAGGFTNVFNGFDIGISFVLSGYTSWQLATGTIAGYMTSTISGSNITNTVWIHELLWSVSYNA